MSIKIEHMYVMERYLQTRYPLLIVTDVVTKACFQLISQAAFRTLSGIDLESSIFGGKFKSQHRT